MKKSYNESTITIYIGFPKDINTYVLQLSFGGENLLEVLSWSLKWGRWQGIRQRTLRFQISHPLWEVTGIKKPDGGGHWWILPSKRCFWLMDSNWAAQVEPNNQLVGLPQLHLPVSWCSQIGSSVGVGIEGSCDECCVLEPAIGRTRRYVGMGILSSGIPSALLLGKMTGSLISGRRFLVLTGGWKESGSGVSPGVFSSPLS